MKKRFSALLLAACLLLSCAPGALAAETGNFVRWRTYAGEFSDLEPTSPFYDNVVALYEYGLANGKTDGTFGLQDALTVGQIVIFAGRVRSLYAFGDPEAGAAAYARGVSAAEDQLRYLKVKGILGGELDDSLGLPATRAQVAHVLAHALPKAEVPDIHNELVTQGYASRRFITDVDEYTPYYQDILDLYRKGISTGSDETGSFRPNEPITRGAAAAMITRLVDPTLRVRPQWDLSHLYSAAETTLADLVEPGVYTISPSTREEVESSIRYMLSRGTNQIVFYAPGAGEEDARKIMSISLSVMKEHCEQGYNEVHCNRGAGFLTLSFTAAGANGEAETYRAAAMEAAIEVHDRLWAEGTLRPDMTEMEKAKVYYEWICSNCEYDYQAGDSSLSHIPYSLFANKKAVCDGYTGAYNLFLKLEGIRCGTYISGGHIWSVATLDGTEYHIDTTWGDSGGEINYDYFAMKPQDSLTIHSSGQAA